MGFTPWDWDLATRNRMNNYKMLKSRGFLKHFVVKTNGMRKRRFDRSTVIIKQSEDKNFHKY